MRTYGFSALVILMDTCVGGQYATFAARRTKGTTSTRRPLLHYPGLKIKTFPWVFIAVNERSRRLIYRKRTLRYTSFANKTHKMA